jgi:hypothetical protein
LLIGAHGIDVTPSGYFIAPLGTNGILTAAPPTDSLPDAAAHMPSVEDLYVYRVIALPSPSGADVVACALRLAGVIAGTFSPSQGTHTMDRAIFKQLDVVDVCALGSESAPLAFVALGRDGSLILFRDALSDKSPKTLRFKTVKGVAYRVRVHRGDVYVHTSKGIFVLAELGSRFVEGTLTQSTVTQLLCIPMSAVDINLAWDRWLLAVTQSGVLSFDADLIHEHVLHHSDDKNSGMVESQPEVLPVQPEWESLVSTARPAVATASG